MPTLRCEGSTPVTSAPSRRIGSVSRPPPQPISHRLRPASGVSSDATRPKCRAAVSRRNPMRVGFSWCSGLKSPCGSHQASAMALNLATSVLSTVVTGSGAVCDDITKNGRIWRKSAAAEGVQPLLRWVPLSMDSRRRQDNALRGHLAAFEGLFSNMNAPAKTKTRVVMKFGGTSVANIERIRAVAQRVKREVDAGNEVAVVVSAMSGATNQMVAWCAELSPLYDAREYDVVVASGEQVTSGLMAIALQTIGVNARSWLGWQIPVESDDAHGKARIQTIRTDDMIARFAQGQVAVVAGFQGIGPDNRVTTLGRGGSDTSAVALAAALK